MSSKAKLENKLAKLPKTPGVYLYKDMRGKIIYVGKAAVLRNRVKQYFQPARPKDTKTDLLVSDIVDIDWLEVGSEIEALFLESELIKRYMPRYNIELRDDKHYEYVRVDIKSPHPTVRTVRRPLDDGATYIGPFVQGIRVALRLLRRIFPYDVSVPAVSKRPSLHYHIGLSPGLETDKTTLGEYRASLRKLIQYLSGKHGSLEKELSRDMKQAAAEQQFERAARLRNQLQALARLRSKVIFGDKELFDITKDQALDGLTRLVELPDLPKRIEGYDISHLSGTNNVASMVVFSSGLPDKAQYRKLQMRLHGNDDFAHMRETITRRFSGHNLEKWPKPDLILIDGGKGQVSAALLAMKDLNVMIPTIGLAKRYEQIILPDMFARSDLAKNNNRAVLDKAIDRQGLRVITLPDNSPVLQLLQRVRDESHRFALSYHSTLRSKAQTKSPLDDIPGIGPAIRKKLIRSFGSYKGVVAASQPDLSLVLGPRRGEALYRHLH